MNQTKRLSRSSGTAGGFTLVELLVALSVSSIILGAVVTLSYALGSANDAFDQTSRTQTQLRHATLRLADLIRHCRLICSSSAADMAVWRADDNGDAQINISELVYVERGSGDHLRLCEFVPANSSPISLGSVQAFSTNWWSIYASKVNYVNLIPQCSNLQFSFDALPPASKFASISFDVLENGAVRRYQISEVLRGWAGHLLNQAKDAIVSDDD